MFDLEKQIVAWRRELSLAGLNRVEVLDELETHLRDQINLSVHSGMTEEAAFQMARTHLGSPQAMQLEFAKLKQPWRTPMVLALTVWGLALVVLSAFILYGFVNGQLGLLLSAHILCLTSGYLAAFVAGALGMSHVWLWKKNKLTLALQQSLTHAARWFNRFFSVLVIGGFALGLFWTQRTHGNYWLGSPWEMGTLCVVFWILGTALVQCFRPLTVRGTMLLYISGSMLVCTAWFGLVLGLTQIPPTYDHYLRTHWALEMVLGVHLLFILMGLASEKPHRAKSA